MLVSTRKQLKTWLRKKVLRGNARFCPCCGESYLVFLPYLGSRDDAQCLNCGSLERHRLFYLYAKNKTSLFEEKTRLVHVAPDPALFRLFRSARNIEYIPCDRFEKGYEYPRGTLNVDLTNMHSFADNSIDAIVCSHVLEHIPADGEAIAEMFRILRPGGVAYVMVPWDAHREQTYEDFAITDPLERRKAFGQSDHVRIYGQDFLCRLKKPGFEVEVVNYFHEISTHERTKLGVRDAEIFVCRKNNA